MKTSIFILVNFICFLLLSCGGASQDSPGLHYPGEDPLILKMGETSDALAFKKVAVVNVKGSLKTTQPYDEVTLQTSNSGDSQYVKFNGLKITAVKKTAMPVTIQVVDKNNSDLSCEFKVIVKAE